MNNELKICLKLIINLIIDNNTYDIYEIHEKYRLSPALIVKAIKILEKKGIICLNDQTIKIVNNLNNTQVFFMNSLCKTKKPENLMDISLDMR